MNHHIELWALASILLTHLLGDFLFQPHWIASNKSKKSWVLILHVTIYSFCFLWMGSAYALVNGGLHLLTDSVTSRLTSKLYKEGKIHMFFVVIGIDQTIHLICLFATVPWLAWWHNG